VDSNLTPTMGYKIDWLTFTLPESLDENFRILKLLGYEQDFLRNVLDAIF
jgi:hypothetical protein